MGIEMLVLGDNSLENSHVSASLENRGTDSFFPDNFFKHVCRVNSLELQRWCNLPYK